MALTAIQGDGTITAGNTTSLTPSAGEVWNIELIVSQDTSNTSNEITFNGNFVYGFHYDEVNPTIVSQHILTNKNDLTIGAVQTDVEYYYSGYKKT